MSGFSVGIDPGIKGYQCLLPIARVGVGARFGEPFFSLPPHDADGRISRPATLALVRGWLSAGVCLVVVEQQQGMNKGDVKQSASAAFHHGETFATWCTALEAAGFREAEGIHDVKGRPEALSAYEAAVGGFSVTTRPVYLVVAAQTWKAHMGCMGAGGERKWALELIVLAAQAGFPGVDLRAVERAKDLKRHKPSPDRAAALLMAEFGRRLLEKNIRA